MLPASAGSGSLNLTLNFKDMPVETVRLGRLIDSIDLRHWLTLSAVAV